ncbi:tail fiber assembly protein [Escherichia coli]|uniref:tail fiber assembly protein n=1 Tax=Escherichia coli TaxID=562 RepID=UPI00101F21E8|nr:tail fiber assembly protein [Escherichia coli]
MYIFDKKTLCFFPLALKDRYIAAGTWPENGVEVDDDTFSEFQVPPAGKMRVAGSDGLPAWGDIPPPTHEELITIAEQVRQQLLTHADAVILDWRTELMLDEISDTNRAKLSAWLAYKNEVKEVDVTTTPVNVNWPAPPEA